MCENMHALLNAYLDGELHGQRLLEVEKHLVSCAACRNDLQELRTVSDLLRAAPAPAFLPVERFVAQLILRLNAQDTALQLPDPDRHQAPGHLQLLFDAGEPFQQQFLIGHGRLLLRGISISGDKIPRTLPAITNWLSRGRWLPLSIRL